MTTSEPINNLLPDSADMRADGLWVGGCPISALVEEYDSPLYIYDEGTLRNVAGNTISCFESVGARVSFAAKACNTLGVLSILAEEGLGLDVVSGGELEAGLKAGFLPDRIHLHGNCKTTGELEKAILSGVHAIVVDNADEIDTLIRLCMSMRARATIALRLSLDFEAHTHPHLKTSGKVSKFGIPDASVELEDILNRVSACPLIRLAGLHTHLGSQITDITVYDRAEDCLVNAAQGLRGRGFAIDEVSIGGGWAVAYSPGEPTLSPSSVANALKRHVADASHIRFAVEPGRSIVARSGIAVYRVGSVKWREGKRIVAVDGGMGDNPRPALYGARYSAVLVRNTGETRTGLADIVGRYCESGDVLARDVDLGLVQVGDHICIPVSGAYQLTMASSYNLVPEPAVVMVRDGESRLLTRRATMSDLFAREVHTSV